MDFSNRGRTGRVLGRAGGGLSLLEDRVIGDRGLTRGPDFCRAGGIHCHERCTARRGNQRESIDGRDVRVSADRACLGLRIHTHLHRIPYIVSPASIEGIDGPTTEAHAKAIQFVYYSFVTLTTLGYGEITPASPVAQTLAYMEAVSGQFYLTILVAALVGMLLSRRQTGE